jgi:hypothetical protein
MIVRGDGTSPQAKGPKLIAHVCNDIGGRVQGLRAGRVATVARAGT